MKNFAELDAKICSCTDCLNAKLGKKISLNEWNTAVAEAMRILEQSENGELTDDEMRALFKAL